ncbi:LOW QUALITY PROTEIN: uncharacterized protein O3Q21_001105 [Podargus strigoides]
MSSPNSTTSSPLTFTLSGIPGLLMGSYWVALPLLCLYLLMLLGNCTLLWVIQTDHSLHAPMYSFLSVLALADLGLSLSTLPTVLAIFWFESTSLRFEACIVQMCFIHSFSAIVGVLVAMAFDRFVAVCHPLRDTSVLTSSLLAKAAIFVRALCVVLPVAVLIKKMPFCRSHVLSHSCLHQDMLRLVCGDAKVNSPYGLTAALLTKGLGSLTTLLSYPMMARAKVSSTSRGARANAFGTCISHPSASRSLARPWPQGWEAPAPLAQTLLVPPVPNPLAYSWKSTQIRRRTLTLLCWRGTRQRGCSQGSSAPKPVSSFLCSPGPLLLETATQGPSLPRRNLSPLLQYSSVPPCGENTKNVNEIKTQSLFDLFKMIFRISVSLNPVKTNVEFPQHTHNTYAAGKEVKQKPRNMMWWEHSLHTALREGEPADTAWREPLAFERICSPQGKELKVPGCVRDERVHAAGLRAEQGRGTATFPEMNESKKIEGYTFSGELWTNSGAEPPRQVLSPGPPRLRWQEVGGCDGGQRCRGSSGHHGAVAVVLWASCETQMLFQCLQHVPTRRGSELPKPISGQFCVAREELPVPTKARNPTIPPVFLPSGSDPGAFREHHPCASEPAASCALACAGLLLHDSHSTWEFNGSFHQPSAFLMMGIPGLEALHHWISIPFCALYLIALLGNCVILFIIKKTQSLHEPMYYFLSMLAVTDLGLVLCTLPTTLGVFWFNMRRIGFDACLTQMYFIHILSFIESSVLLAMAFDRFIAISHPLRHPSILTRTTVIKIGLAIILRGMVSLLPIPFLLKRLTYCGKTELSHSFCFHPDIMNLACADIKVNVFYGMIILLSTVGMDFIFIVLSYILIIKTVIGLATKEECLKALNTCVSHICAVLVFFIPMIGLSMIHRFGKDVPPLVNTLVAYTYLIIPPALNPIIYSIKASHIREALLRALRRKSESDW